MDGDIALSEAAISLKCFHKLADIGVNFPQNSYGEFLDYSNDSENKNIKCVIDAGMFTVKKITEQFEKRILENDIPIFNRFRVISVIKDTDEAGNDYVVGLLAVDKDMQTEYKGKMAEYIKNTRRLEANKNIFGKIQSRLLGGNKNTNPAQIRYDNAAIEEYDGYTEEPIGNKYGYTLFRAVNIIYAAGSPGGIYCDTASVYPTDAEIAEGKAWIEGGKAAIKAIVSALPVRSGMTPYELELIVPRLKWPVPTYGDLLFSVR